MAGYSKESERQNKALKSILRGETPEKKIIIAVEDKEFKEKMKLEREGERKKSAERFDSLKEFRMPWFCPRCNKTMKKKLDNKFWRIQGVCFDCIIDMENDLRINGKYESYEKRKMLENRLSWVKDMIQGIEEWRNEGDVKFYNQNRPDGYSVDEETWEQDSDHVNALADEAMTEMNKIKSEVEAELSKYI